MKKETRITFRIGADLKREVDRLAKLKNISSGQLIRNWIDVFTNPQSDKAPLHFYQTDDGKVFTDMKSLCEKLNISSHAARKLIKSEVIKKFIVTKNQAQEYGGKLQITRSNMAEGIRV